MTVRKFEAVKYALRQSKDGVVVSFVVHPNDVDDRLTVLPIGARVAIGWVEIADDETTDPPGSSSGRTTGFGPVNGGSSPSPGTKKERTPFAKLPASQQAGMRCSEVPFADFLQLNYAYQWQMYDSRDFDKDAQAAHVVRHLCRVNSRALLDEVKPAREEWQIIESRYQQFLTDNRYGEQVR